MDQNENLELHQTFLEAAALLDDEAISGPLLTTKLHRPLLTSDLVVREQLLQLMNRQRQRPFTLVSAPAGYGKTTLVNNWLESVDYPYTWYQLDENDNDIAVFLTYLITAVQRLFPDVGRQTRSLLKVPTLPPLSVLSATFISELHAVTTPFILVLDDYHLIENREIHDFLSELFKHPHPSMKLVIATRQDPPLPLAKLRGQGWLTEIRQGSLSFSPQETAAFLQTITHTPIDKDTAVEITEKTDGWVTALRLMALSLRNQDQNIHMLADLPGNVHYVTEYLVSEVLSAQPDSVQEFLLKTSILNRFRRPLCEALCGPEPEDREDTLTRLNQQNLFIIPLDHQNRWFRYHHLFQDLLKAQLRKVFSKAEITALHATASRWFAENRLFDEALQHALLAGDIAFAEQLVEQNRYRLMNTEQWRRLDHWLELLPPETFQNNPFLLNTKAWIIDRHGDIAQVFAIRDQVQALLDALPTETAGAEAVRGEIAALNAYQLSFGGDAQAALEYADEALDLTPEDALHVRSYGIGFRFLSHQMLGNFEKGLQQIDTAVRQSEQYSGVFLTKLVYPMCIGSWMEGDLPDLERQAHQLLNLGQENQLEESISFARYFLGVTHYFRDEIAEAKDFLQVIGNNPYTSNPIYFTFGAFALALCHLADDHTREASDVIAFVNSHLTQANDASTLEMVRAFQVELALRQGKIDEASMLGRQASFDLLPPVWLFYIFQLTPVKLLLAQNTPESLKQAAELLGQLDSYLAGIHRNTIRIDTLALQALVLDAQNEDKNALAKLSESLALAEPGGFIRNYIDLGPDMAGLLLRLQFQGEKYHFISRILAAFPDITTASTTPTSSPSQLVESLTGRELETLRYLATDLSINEIAAQMKVSPATVRTHTKNLYSKLDVHSRMQAVVTARELELI